MPGDRKPGKLGSRANENSQSSLSSPLRKSPPLPPTMVSLPPPPVSVSSPSLPEMVSPSEPPLIVSSSPPPVKVAIATPCQCRSERPNHATASAAEQVSPDGNKQIRSPEPHQYTPKAPNRLRTQYMLK